MCGLWFVARCLPATRPTSRAQSRRTGLPARALQWQAGRSRLPARASQWQAGSGEAGGSVVNFTTPVKWNAAQATCHSSLLWCSFH